jgi:hypothetical protein
LLDTTNLILFNQKILKFILIGSRYNLVFCLPDNVAALVITGVPLCREGEEGVEAARLLTAQLHTLRQAGRRLVAAAAGRRTVPRGFLFQTVGRQAVVGGRQVRSGNPLDGLLQSDKQTT